MSAWRLEYGTQGQAQTKADAVHTWMIANNSAYARSVTAGQTLRWAIPYRDRDGSDNPTGNWWVNIKDRSFDALSASEKTAARVITGREATDRSPEITKEGDRDVR